MVSASILSREEFDRTYALMAGVLSDIRGQVQFAEAKNGALFATSMAVIVGIGAVLSAGTGSVTSMMLWLGAISITMAGSAFVSLISFLPVMGPRRHLHSRGRDGGGENLLYSGEIQHFTPSDYLDAVLRSLEVHGKPQVLLVDLADQIVINASIAERKFRRFTLAARITSVAIVVPTATFIAHLAVNGFRIA